MSVEDVVQYENHSLKQYTTGSQTEIIRKAGVLIKVDEYAAHSGMSEQTEGKQIEKLEG